MTKFTRHPPVELTCETCRIKFKVPYWRTQEKGYAARFCSRKCNGQSRVGINRDPSISLKGVASRYANGTYNDRVSVNCIQCGKRFETVPSKIEIEKGKYCSRKCMAEYYHVNHRGPRSSHWKNGASFGKYCFKFNRTLKDNVSNFFSDRCVLCHKTVSENILSTGAIRRLSIHHVYTEKMACCETKIGEMDTLRNRLPKTIAKYGEQEFSDDEIRHIRMLVPLCITCHGKMLKEEYLDTPYEETTYRKYFTDLINNEYGGRCYD